MHHPCLLRRRLHLPSLRSISGTRRPPHRFRQLTLDRNCLTSVPSKSFFYAPSPTADLSFLDPCVEGSPAHPKGRLQCFKAVGAYTLATKRPSPRAQPPRWRAKLLPRPPSTIWSTRSANIPPSNATSLSFATVPTPCRPSPGGAHAKIAMETPRSSVPTVERFFHSASSADFVAAPPNVWQRVAQDIAGILVNGSLSLSLLLFVCRVRDVFVLAVRCLSLHDGSTQM